MNFNGTHYVYILGPLGEEMTVHYYIIAKDNAGNSKTVEGSFVTVDTTPPVIESITTNPEIAVYNDSVEVIINVYDPYREDEYASGVSSVVVYYTYDGSSWEKVSASFDGTSWHATIPSYPYGTKISFYVEVTDVKGNKIQSEVHSYVVGDPYAPVLSPVTTPESVEAGSEFKVVAESYEPLGASGIKYVVLVIEVNGVNTTYTMTNYEGNLWDITLGPYEYGSTIRYWIFAEDNARNVICLGPFVLQIVDTKPPEINIETPTQINYDDSVILVAKVSSGAYGSNISNVEFIISVNGKNITLTPEFNGTHYVYDLGKFKYGTSIQFKVVAYDEAGNYASESSTIEIVDRTAPVIENISMTMNETTITIYATVNEPTEASGIQYVVLYYRTDGNWTEVVMKEENGTWVCYIKLTGTKIDYKIVAIDNGGNKVESQIYTIELEKSRSISDMLRSPIVLIITPLAMIGAVLIGIRKRKG